MKERGRGLGGEKMLFGDRCFSPLSAYLVLLLQLVAPTFLETWNMGSCWMFGKSRIYIYNVVSVERNDSSWGNRENPSNIDGCWMKWSKFGNWKIHQIFVVVEWNSSRLGSWEFHQTLVIVEWNSSKSEEQVFFLLFYFLTKKNENAIVGYWEFVTLILHRWHFHEGC